MRSFNKHIHIRNIKYAAIGFLVMTFLLLPMLTILPELSQVTDIQTDFSTLVIKQTVEDTFEIAVNWGSRPGEDPPPPSIDSSEDIAGEDSKEIARVNWGSRPIGDPPPSDGSVDDNVGEDSKEIARVNWGSSPIRLPLS